EAFAQIVPMVSKSVSKSVSESVRRFELPSGAEKREEFAPSSGGRAEPVPGKLVSRLKVNPITMGLPEMRAPNPRPLVKCAANAASSKYTHVHIPIQRQIVASHLEARFRPRCWRDDPFAMNRGDSPKRLVWVMLCMTRDGEPSCTASPAGS